MRLLAALLSLALVGPVMLRAQAATGSIGGRVVDDRGSGVAEAAVLAAQRDGSYRRVAQTDARGAFNLAALPPGAYDVTVQRLGHRPAVARGVAVRAGDRTEVVLTLARTAQELAPIVVAGSAVTLQRSQPTFETRVDERVIAQLPVGADAARLVALTPGVRPDQMWGGSGVQANAYQLNGVTATHPGTGGQLLTPNVSWIEQLQVRGLGAGAAHGGFQGGLIDVVTKSGSNTRTGFARVSLETHRLNGSNLTRTEDVPEIESRNEIDAEARGPIVRDRLFYYVSGQGVRSVRRAVDFLGVPASRFAPLRETSDDARALAKLTWTPASGDLVNASAGVTHEASDRFGYSGRETAEATTERTAPTLFAELGWERALGGLGHVDVRGAAMRADDHRRPLAGRSVPGVATYQVATSRRYQNAAFEERLRPASVSGAATWRTVAMLGSTAHRVSVGADVVRGSWLHHRTRTGGMTWRPRYYAPVSRTFDAANPATWDPKVPTSWGGEIRVDARTTGAAMFAEDEMTWGRLTVVPGVRAARWTGSIRDTSGAFITPLRTSGIDPRIGAVVDLSGAFGRMPGGAPNAAQRHEPTFVLRAHWGRYHQATFAEMFDRAAGTASYSDLDLWEYQEAPGADPTRSFTRRQRDSLAAAGSFTRIEHVELSQTGRVEDFAQPYVDQWVVGAEKSLFGRIRIGALWIRRDNYNITALVDRNMQRNWTAFDDVSVWFRGRQLYDHAGNPLVLPTMYLRNDAIRFVLTEHARLMQIDRDLAAGWTVPGFVDADTINLTYTPDFVLTAAPEARRKFEQFQGTASIVFARWSLNGSVALNNLRGNLFTVSGYDAATVSGRDGLEGRGPGPYVRPNEQANYWGKPDNYSTLEMKVFGAAELPWKLRAGAFWYRVSGDRLTPDFTVSRYGLSYHAGSSPASAPPLRPDIVASADGHRIFTSGRGSYKYEPRQTVDLRLARAVAVRGEDWELAVEAFNVLGDRSVTLVNTHLVAQADPNFDVRFFDPLRRVDPRRLRLTALARF